MTHYRAKKDTWFKEGTNAILITKIDDDTGLFEGLRVPQFRYEFAIGRDPNGEIDQEVCLFEEFDIIED